MEHEDDISSMTSQNDVSKRIHEDEGGNSSTAVAHMATVSVGESHQAQNTSSATVGGAQQLSAGDLEALANIQEELDRLAQAPPSTSNPSDAQDEEQGVVGVQEGVTGTSVLISVPNLKPRSITLSFF